MTDSYRDWRDWLDVLTVAARMLTEPADRRAEARRFRMAAAVAAHDDGLTFAAIGRGLGVTRQTVTALIAAGRDDDDAQRAAAAITDAAAAGASPVNAAAEGVAALTEYPQSAARRRAGAHADTRRR